MKSLMKSIMESKKIFHSQIMKSLENKSDEERSKMPLLHDAWRVDRECVINEVYSYKGELYRCRQTHTTQTGWEPNVTEALFKKLMYRNGVRIIPEVITTGDMFTKDELGWWNDTLYKSLMDANVYTPEQYAAGWEIVEV